MIKTAIWALLALSMSTAVVGAASFTNVEYYIEEGVPYTITWAGNRGSVAITLMRGPDENLEEVLVIVSGYDGQEYTWTPPSTLPADSYVLRLEDAGSADYSPRFRYPAPPPSTTSDPGVSTPLTSQQRNLPSLSHQVLLTD